MKKGLTTIFKRLLGVSRIDGGVVRVGLLVAMLDGKVERAELDEVRRYLIEHVSDAALRDTFWEASLRSAGFLLLQAHLLSPKALAEVFATEAMRGLPATFFECPLETYRAAFKAWMAVAKSDGVLGEVERLSLERLRVAMDLRLRVENAVVSGLASRASGALENAMVVSCLPSSLEALVGELKEREE